MRSWPGLPRPPRRAPSGTRSPPCRATGIPARTGPLSAAGQVRLPLPGAAPPLRRPASPSPPPAPRRPAPAALKGAGRRAGGRQRPAGRCCASLASLLPVREGAFVSRARPPADARGQRWQACAASVPSKRRGQLGREPAPVYSGVSPITASGAYSQESGARTAAGVSEIRRRLARFLGRALAEGSPRAWLPSGHSALNYPSNTFVSQTGCVGAH